MMKRRQFITLLGGAAAAWPVAARAQRAGMPVVGFLHAGTPSAFASLVTAFREGLDTAGYVEGRSVAIEYRWAENHYERLPALLTDLVGRRVAVIAALGDGPAATAKAGTSAIPVVVMAASDPVGAGLVGSLNRPGGNITGISMFTSDLMAKRIELLTELVPKATTIGLLVNPTGRRAGADTNEAQAAARALGQQIEVFNAGSADEIDAAFITLVQRRMGALVTGTDVLFTTDMNKSRHSRAATASPPSFLGASSSPPVAWQAMASHMLSPTAKSAGMSAASSKARNRAICRFSSPLNSSSLSTSRLPRRSASKCRRRCSPEPTR